MKKYYVHYMNGGIQRKEEFPTLLLARKFAVERLRSGHFLRLENQNGTLLPL